MEFSLILPRCLKGPIFSLVFGLIFSFSSKTIALFSELAKLPQHYFDLLSSERAAYLISKVPTKEVLFVSFLCILFLRNFFIKEKRVRHSLSVQQVAVY